MTRRPLPLERVGQDLATGCGLTGAEARRRLAVHGANAIVEVPGRPWLDLARETAADPMIWFLGALGILYGVVGEVAEAFTLLVAIVPLVGMDVVLHRRTRASTEGLRGRLAERATVERDGRVVEVAATDLVPGDLVLVTPGAIFPADGVVVAGADLQADESILTGEAYPVGKRPLEALPADGPEPAVDHDHWVFAGSRLLTGRASARVVYTGGETLYGEIVRSAVRGVHARTPLQAAIRRLVTGLLAAAAVICVVLGAVRLRQGHGWLDAVVSAVTLASAALPEEFPVVFTFFLGVGVYRLARRQALVRRAVSVENIGRVSCICSDKTGTMTEGRLTLTHLVPVEGVSQDRLLGLAALASRADSGDFLDAAVLAAAAARKLPAERSRVVATFPFTENRRRETTVLRLPEEGLLGVTKGAAETILDACDLRAADAETWSRRIGELAQDGHKVIGAAWRPLRGDEWDGEEPGRGFRFAGLVALEDPVREGVAEAVRRCRAGGVHTIMVTGDHPVTARAVAREVGLGGNAPQVIIGDELDRRVARGEGSTLRGVDVIARAGPSQKLALVRALQEAGEVVAVTGDGVNDVPALQSADVGVAMGERGTRSAREVAAIVLLDDNFRTIVRAIGEGRQLFENLRLAFAYLLIVHLPLVMTALLVPLAGYPLLYLPVHIVWLEVIIHPTAILVFQELPAGEGPRGRAGGRTARFFAGREWALILLAGMLLSVLVLAGYLRSVEERGAPEHGRAMALAVLTLGGAATTSALSGLRTVTSRLVAGGTVALSATLLQVPPVAHLLHVAPLHVDEWATAVGAALTVGGLALVLALQRRLSP